MTTFVSFVSRIYRLIYIYPQISVVFGGTSRELTERWGFSLCESFLCEFLAWYSHARFTHLVLWSFVFPLFFLEQVHHNSSLLRVTLVIPHLFTKWNTLPMVSHAVCGGVSSYFLLFIHDTKFYKKYETMFEVPCPLMGRSLSWFHYALLGHGLV